MSPPVGGEADCGGLCRESRFRLGTAHRFLVEVYWPGDGSIDMSRNGVETGGYDSSRWVMVLRAGVLGQLVEVGQVEVCARMGLLIGYGVML